MAEDGFSMEWERLWKERDSYAKWPWSDVVSAVHRHTDHDTEEFAVLELGCGAGTNLPFFLDLDVEYYGIEGSEYIVNELHDQYPDLENQLVSADFTEEIPFSSSFDLVLDRGSVTANSESGIRRALSLAYDQLVSGGRIISIDLVSTEHTEFRRGESGPDEYTRKGFDSGQFEKMGTIHFWDREHIIDLFADFDLISLEHTRTEQHYPADDYVRATWNLVGKK
ncbi:class I SAM-dependent methyltransferase [Natrarchaeobius sp. A-rgal3]|uniref:class I SAM-dependent methyltransferase n=1 Tax=Natrarchaeobius versutus TaxID=1679078 RepID=UPI00350FBE8B